MKNKVIIIDFGSQFTQLIARRIREIGVYSEIISLRAINSITEDISAIILSGGPNSVHNEELYNHCTESIEYIFHLNEKYNIPILGICFGKQLICKYFGAQIVNQHKPEFGKADITIYNHSTLTHQDHALNWQLGEQITVWMSHADSVTSLPEGFIKVASTERCEFAIIAHEDRRIYGLQFHPEVSHTANGKALLENFLNIAQCHKDWSIKSFIQEEQEHIKQVVGNKQVIAAVSGGVDSTVAAALTHKVIGEQLHCLFIDTGLLRKNEARHVQDAFTNKFHIPVRCHDASEIFLSRLSGITSPEQKRKIIGNTFIEIFEQEAQNITNVDFLLQGTLYPDVIESGLGASASIKSHHNVGGLPDKMNLKLLEPLRTLFKDEVRSLGLELGLAPDLVYRHPFPGPGLAVRIIGEITPEKIAILQEADDIYISTMHEYDLYNDIWQAFVVLLPIKTVGVMGDQRTYEYVCSLRAVTSSDGMTANVFPFENQQKQNQFWNFLQEVSNKIVNNVQGINRVTYDITSKPPGTIEWE